MSDGAANSIGVAAEPGDARAAAKELRWMFAAAIALRVAVFLTMTLVFGFSLKRYSEWADGKSYLWMAQAYAGSPPSYLREYDHRVFPGFPAILAIVFMLKLPLAWTALGISWICSGLSAVFTARLFNDRRMGWAMVTLTPQYVLNGSMVMTESIMMALMLGGLLLAQRKQNWLGGIVAGISGLVRPMACFAVLGQCVHEIRARRWRPALTYGGVAALTVALAMVVLQWKTGDALQGPRVYASHDWAYGGHMFDWPFHSLVATIFGEKMRLWKLTYILLHVPLVLYACVVLWKRYRREHDVPDALVNLMGPWLWGNTLFVVCVGSHWALLQFARFILVALPPLLWVYLPYLPRRPRGWILWAGFSYFGAVGTFAFI